MEALGGIIGGIASGIGSLFGNDKAADAQMAAIKSQEKWQQQQQQMAQPFLQSANIALEKRNDILGLNGPEAQSNALAALANDENWQAQMDAINGAVERSAVAKGQTGGNVLAALADRAQQYKYGQIQNYLGNLQGDINQGQNALAQMGSVGTNAANQISNLQSNAGQFSGAGVTGLFQGVGNALTEYQRQQGRNTVGGI